MNRGLSSSSATGARTDGATRRTSAAIADPELCHPLPGDLAKEAGANTTRGVKENQIVPIEVYCVRQ